MARRKRDLASLVESLWIEEYASSSPGPTVGFVKMDMCTRTKRITGRTDFPSDYTVRLYFKLKREDAEVYRDTNALLRDLANYMKSKTPIRNKVKKSGDLSYNIRTGIWVRQTKRREFEARSNYIGAVDIFLDYAIEVLGKKRVTVTQNIGDRCIDRSYRYPHQK